MPSGSATQEATGYSAKPHSLAVSQPFFFLAVLLMSGLVFQTESFSQANLPPDFKGKCLLALSDADMVASAYIDGKLGADIGKDALAVISLANDNGKASVSTIEATNSVTGPPASLAVSPDGKYAIVIETRGVRPAGKSDAMMKDLSAGHAVMVVDISDPAHLRITQKLQERQQTPQSVDISPDGSLVAVAYVSDSGRQKPLMIYRFNDGLLSRADMPDVPGWREGDNLVGASFYNDSILALLNIGNQNLAFYTLSGISQNIKLTPWGNKVSLDKAPFLIRFAQGGRFALCNSMYFGPDVAAGGPLGTVTCIRIANGQAAGGSPVHQVISRALTSYTPEGLAVSPDGQWIATANLEQSADPLNSPHQSFYSSVSLLHLDTAGHLTRTGDFAFSGILPETVLFDNSSRYVVVTSFDHYADKAPGGSVDFWRISPDWHDPSHTELVQTGYSVAVKRGVHSMVIVR